jgi:predicted dinucleotide-binding enzyme
VIVGSRDPKRRAAAWSVSSSVPVTGLVEAARSAEVTINATPGRSSVATLRPLAAELRGKALIDIANAVEQGPDGFASSLIYPDGSLAEELQRALPDTKVVKTLNTLGPATLMVHPMAVSTPPSAFLSGDDQHAKKIVADLLTDLSWPQDWIIDLGDITTARVPEAFVLLVRPLVHALGPVPFGLAVAR